MSTPTDLEQQALHALHSGQFEQARGVLESLLAEFPDHPDYLHQLGVVYAQLGQLPMAAKALQDALRLAPGSAACHSHLGNVWRAMGNYEQAEQAYRQALKLKPDYPEGLNNLGALYYRQGKTKQAIETFLKAIRLDPNSIDAHYNLGNAYVRDDQALSALTHYRQVLDLSPEHLGAHHNLGILLVNVGKLTEAKPHLRRALAADTRDLDAHFHYAMILAAQGKVTEAKGFYETVLKQCPNHAHAHHNLATLLLAEDHKEQALAHYEKALALNPQNTTAAHLIKALTGQAVTQAPESYIQDLFDHYANHYDQHVKEGLDYQVPHLLRQMIRPYKRLESDPWFAIDLGCGTGLCASYFTDIVGRLIGIDLSEQMIHLAKQQGGYHRLHTGEIVKVLEREYRHCADLLIAADVFVYLGDLHAVFAACANALRPSGFFVLSIEETQDCDTFMLQPSGRFAHNQAYVTQTALSYGLKCLESTPARLRTHQGAPLEGRLILLQKSKA